MKRALLSALLVLTLSACGGSSAAPTYPRLDPSQVVLYASEAEIPGEFEIVRFLQPPSRRGYSSDEARTQELVAQAAQVGANGLLTIDENAEIADGRIAAALSSQGSYSRVAYVAIFVPPARRGGAVR